MPREISTNSDMFNQDIFVRYFQKQYDIDPFKGVLPAGPRQELRELAMLAQLNPVLSLAAAQCLYMFGWFGEGIPGDGTDIEVAEAAAHHFEESIVFSGCQRSDLTRRVFHDELSCHMRWSHAVAIRNYLMLWYGERQDLDMASKQLQHGAQLIQMMKQTSFFNDSCCNTWQLPSDFNFNAVFFRDLPSHVIWPEEKRPPIAKFLEDHYMEIKQELAPLLEVHRSEWNTYGPLVNAEHLASGEGDWHMLAIVRYGAWNDLFCNAAPRTCELLASRPEVANCTLSNSNIMRLAPGGFVKPHFGNAPRLSLHLPLNVPEPDKAWMRVGGEQLGWTEGRVVVFDDTYAHSVRNFGTMSRHVMNVWFCHPCDKNEIHQHGQECPL